MLSTIDCASSSLSALRTAGSSSFFSSLTCCWKTVPQLRDLAAKFRAVARGLVEFGQELAHPLVVFNRLGNEVFGLLVLPQNREKMLLFELSQKLELLCKIGKQPLPRLGRTLAGIDELGEKFIGFDRTGLNQLSNGGHLFLMK